MHKNYIKIFFVVLVTCLCCTHTYAADCQYQWTAAVLRDSCVGIAKELREIKTTGTANVVVSAIGTGAAGGALYAGIKKSNIDKKIADLQQQMENVKNMSDADFVKFLKNMAAFEEAKAQYNNMCNLKRQLQTQAKNLGNWRTGLMVGNTATAVAGTVISTKNNNESGNIKEMIQKCLDSIEQSKYRIGQAQFDCSPGEYRNLQNAVTACSKMTTMHMDKVSKNTDASKVVSAVNIGTGLVGTITSALANSKNTAANQKKMDTVANVFAGASAVASGTSTVFNAVTLKAINDNLNNAIACEEAIGAL